MLEIKTDNKFCEEKQWIVSTLIGEFLGLEYELSFNTESQGHTSINYNKNSLVINDEFFSMDKDNWLAESSLPDRPLSKWLVGEDISDVNLVSPELPVLYGK